MAITSSYQLVSTRVLSAGSFSDLTQLNTGGFIATGAGQHGLSILDANGAEQRRADVYGFDPSSTQLNNGNIVVATHSPHVDPIFFEHFIELNLTIFRPDGSVLTGPRSETILHFANFIEVGGPVGVDVTGLTGGGFVVSATDLYGATIALRLYDANAQLVSDITIPDPGLPSPGEPSDQAPPYQYHPKVAGIAQDKFAATWVSIDGDGNHEVWYGVYDASGNEVKAPTFLEAMGVEIVGHPAVMSTTGGFVVAYEAADGGSGTQVVRLSRFDFAGNILDTVTAHPAGGATSMSDPELARLPGASGLIALAMSTDAGNGDTVVQLYDANTGTFVAGLNALGGGRQADPLEDPVIAGTVSGRLALYSRNDTTGLTQGELIQVVRRTEGDAGNNAIIGDALSDYISGFGGVDDLQGGAGDDVLKGGVGADALNGGSGTDTADYAGEFGAVKIDLGAGLGFWNAAHQETLIDIENVVGTVFNDTLIGNAGSNLLRGGVGADTLNGGAGVDIADYSGEYGAVKIDLTLGTGLWNVAHGDRLAGIEAVIGTSFADYLIGDAGANLLRGGVGADILDGRAGTDTIDYSGEYGAIKASLALGSGRWNAAEGDAYIRIENIIGTDFNDVLTGNADVNVLNGGNGNDVLQGLGGADILIGGGGLNTADYSGGPGPVTVNLALGPGQLNAAQGDTYSSIENVIGTAFADRLTGDASRNSLNGGGGSDILNGGLGDDILTGSGGADQFVFDTALSTQTRSNEDQLLDFEVGVDKIVLSSSIFQGLSKGALPSSSFIVGDFPSPSSEPESEAILYNTSFGYLSYYADGMESDIIFARLPGIPDLTAADFLIV